MNIKNISNVSFAWASVLFGSVGANLLIEKDYVLGSAFVVGALAVIILREVLKKYGIDVKK